MNNEKFVSLFREHLDVILSDVEDSEKEKAVENIFEKARNEYVANEELAEVYYHLGDCLLPMRGDGGRSYYARFFEKAYDLYKSLNNYDNSFKCGTWIINSYNELAGNYYSNRTKAATFAEKAMYYYKDLLTYAEKIEGGKKQLYCKVMTIASCCMLHSLQNDLFNSHLDEFLVDYYPEDKNTAKELYYHLGISIYAMLTKEKIRNNSALYTKYQEYYEKLRSLLNNL